MTTARRAVTVAVIAAFALSVPALAAKPKPDEAPVTKDRPSESMEKKGSTLTFTEVYDHLDARKNTKLHVDEYWKSVKGTEMSGSGTVVDVKRKGKQAEVTVKCDGRPAANGFNVALTVPDVSAAADLKRGATIKFRGQLANAKEHRNGARVIYLTGAELK